jgi:hypothetical protein
MVALVALAPGQALATDTRTESMGGGSTAWIVEDEVNALYLPSTLLLFPSMIYADVGMDDERPENADVPYNVGFFIKYNIKSKVALAVYASSIRQYVAGNFLDRAFGGQGLWSQVGELDPGMGETDGDHAIHNADHKATILAAQRVSNIRLGQSISIWADNYDVPGENEDESYERGGYWLEGTLSLGLDLRKKHKIDMALKVFGGSYDDKYCYVDCEAIPEDSVPENFDPLAKGNCSTPGGKPGRESELCASRLAPEPDWGIGFIFRGMFGVKGEKIIPYASFELRKGGVDYREGPEDGQDVLTSDYMQIGLDLGLSFRLQPLEKVLIYPAIGLFVYYEVIDDKLVQAGGVDDPQYYDYTNLVLAPYIAAALDLRLATWFSMRIGLRQYLGITKVNDDGDKTRDDFVNTVFRFGPAFHIKGLDIEFMLNPMILLSGPYMLTGNDYEEFAFQAALKYSW